MDDRRDWTFETLLSQIQEAPDTNPEETSIHLLRHFESALEHCRAPLEGGADEEAQRLEEVRKRQDDLLESIRRTLRGLEDEVEPSSEADSSSRSDLDRLEAWCDPYRDESSRTITCATRGEGPLPESSRPALRHIVRDALASLIDTGDVATIAVTLAYHSDHLTLTIAENDGDHIPEILEAPEGDWATLRDRARQLEGELTIETSWREGTSIVLEMPLESALEASSHASGPSTTDSS